MSVDLCLVGGRTPSRMRNRSKILETLPGLGILVKLEDVADYPKES